MARVRELRLLALVSALASVLTLLLLLHLWGTGEAGAGARVASEGRVVVPEERVLSYPKNLLEAAKLHSPLPHSFSEYLLYTSHGATAVRKHICP